MPKSLSKFGKSSSGSRLWSNRCPCWRFNHVIAFGGARVPLLGVVCTRNSSASILLGELPEEMVKMLPRYPALPAVLIGRPARDTNFPGTGKLLLLDALTRAFRHSAEVAASVVLVDAKNQSARDFYAGYGFHEVLQTPNRMFLRMATIENLQRPA